MRFLNPLIRDCFVYAVGLALLIGLTTVMDSVVLIDGDPSVGWFNMVNLHHNSFISWRFGHLTQALLTFFPISMIAEKPVAALAILLLGTTLCIRAAQVSSGLNPRYSALYAVLPCALIVLSVGIDPLVLGTLCWAPLLAVSALHLVRQPNSVLVWAILGVLSVENSFNANQVALVSGGLSLALAAALSRYSSSESSPPRDTWIWLSAIILVPAAITLLITPMPYLPKYPRSAHVVPFSNFEGYVKPLLGPAYPFDSIDRIELKNIYSYSSVIVSGLASILYLLARIRLQPLTRGIILSGLAFGVVASLDTRLPEEWAMIAPVASVSRLLPWAGTYALTSIALGLSAWCIGYVVAISQYKRCVAITLIAAVILASHGSQELYHPYLRVSGLADDAYLSPILRTPSAGLIKRLAFQHPNVRALLTDIEEAPKLPRRDVKSMGATVDISPQPSSKILAEATRLESSFRWSSRTGQQHGNELLTIRFVSPTRVRGIELDPGVYATDYPRGLTVSGGPCSEPDSAQELFKEDLWQGTLHVTSKGMPYFSARNEVRVLFPTEVTVECLFARQTARAPFDWSITKIAIIQSAETK